MKNNYMNLYEIISKYPDRVIWADENQKWADDSFSELYDYLDGFKPGSLYGLTGLLGMGHFNFMLDMALDMALSGKTVYFTFARSSYLKCIDKIFKHLADRGLHDEENLRKRILPNKFFICIKERPTLEEITSDIVKEKNACLFLNEFDYLTYGSHKGIKEFAVEKGVSCVLSYVDYYGLLGNSMRFEDVTYAWLKMYRKPIYAGELAMLRDTTVAVTMQDVKEPACFSYQYNGVRFIELGRNA